MNLLKAFFNNSILLLILLLSLILRLILVNQSFWLDEAITAITAFKPFPYQLVNLGGDFQPPLYYVLIHILTVTHITSEWFLRMPSVLFGLLSIWVTFKLGSEILNKKTAILASILMATSQFQIYYSQELRMYSLLCFISGLSMWFFYKKKHVLLFICHIVGLYTSYMYVFIPITQFLFLILNRSERRYLRNYFITVAGSLILFVPWLPVMYQQWLTSREIIHYLPGWSSISKTDWFQLLPQVLLKFSIGRINFDDKIFYGILFICIAAFYGYIFYRLLSNINHSVKLLMSWLIIPLAAVAIFSIFVPISGIWRLIFLQIPFVLLVSYGLTKIKHPQWFISGIICIQLSGVILYWMRPVYQRERWKEAVSFVEKTDYPVVFTEEDGFAPFQWYNSDKRMPCGPASIQRCLSGNRTIVYVSYLESLFDPEKKIQKAITSSGFQVLAVNNFEGVGFVYTYENRN